MGDTLLCPHESPLHCPAQFSSPTPRRSSGAADPWKQTLGEVKFLPGVLPSPLTPLHFFLLTPEFQT